MTVKRSLFDAGTIEQTTDSLAAHAPDGVAWVRKYEEGANLRGLLRGMAAPFNALEEQIEYAAQEFAIEAATDTISDWEASVGLPDACSPTSSTLAERRTAVANRLRHSPTVTLAEMQAIVDAAYPGAGIVLIAGADVGSLEASLEMILFGDVCEKFILVARVPQGGLGFEYGWQIPFTGGLDTTALECALRKIIPANVLLLIDEVPNA